MADRYANALDKFLTELPYLLIENNRRKNESALAHERALQLKTLDQVDPKYYEYNDDGSINTKNSMMAQQEGVKWQLAGASAGLGDASSFAYGTQDESAGAYTHDDYSRDKAAINELTLSENIGYNDALNIINMGLFDMDGDELMPGGASAEDMAEAMTEGDWWNVNKGKIRKRSDSYFQGVLMNPQFMDAEKYQSYKTNEVAMRQTQLENLITQPAYTTAQETVNTLMDAAGTWQARAGLKAVNDDGETQYYNPNTGKEMDLDDFAREFSATYQLMTSSQPLEWMHQHYKNGGRNNAVIKQLIKESPGLSQNYIIPLFDEMETISNTRNAYEQQSVALTDFSEPTAIPQDLDTALKAFQSEDATGNMNVTDPLAGPQLQTGQPQLGTDAERIRVLTEKGVDPQYITMLGDSIAQYTDDDILYGSWENAYITEYDPKINPDAYEDINNIQNEELKNYVVNRMTATELGEFKQYINRADAGVDDVTPILTGLTDDLISERTDTYAREREEYVAANQEYKDTYAEKWALEAEIASLRESLDQMHDIEYEDGDDLFYNVPVIGRAQSRSVVNAGESEIIGEAGSKLFNTIQQKEKALESLNYLLGHTDGGQLATTQVSRTSSARAPMLENLENQRLEAQEAKESLERLIKEELDDLPELYRTQGGKF